MDWFFRLPVIWFVYFNVYSYIKNRVFANYSNVRNYRISIILKY